MRILDAKNSPSYPQLGIALLISTYNCKSLSAQILRTMYIFTNTLVVKYKSIRNGTKKGANDLKVFNKIKAVPRIIRP